MWCHIPVKKVSLFLRNWNASWILSPPKRFGLTEILHGTSALGGDRFNNRFSKRRELSQSITTNYSKLPVLLVTHF
jgi:hypothetical protein